MSSHHYPVSIIIPIYNVEKYIEKCVISLFEQDFDDIEYIFVNDCTPDNSVAILENLIEKYPNRKPHIKIIHHKENSGSGATRQTGIKNATGNYTIQIDSDDWCELNMISELYRKAVETDAEIVACDFFINEPNKEIYQKNTHSKDLSHNLNLLLINSGSIFPAIYSRLIKRSVYINNNIYPPAEISFAEDWWLMVRLYFSIKTIDYIPKAFVHYRRDNATSLTTNISEKTWKDLKYYIETTEIFLKENNIFEKYKKSFYQGYILSIKCILGKYSYKKYRKIFFQVLPKSFPLITIWKLDVRFINKLRYSFILLQRKFSFGE